MHKIIFSRVTQTHLTLTDSQSFFFFQQQLKNVSEVQEQIGNNCCQGYVEEQDQPTFNGSHRPTTPADSTGPPVVSGYNGTQGLSDQIGLPGIPGYITELRGLPVQLARRA